MNYTVFFRNCPEVGGFSLSSGDLISRNKQQYTVDAVSKWNPFADCPSFSQVTEDHLFGAEFDKIRQEGKIFCFILIHIHRMAK